MFFLKQIDAILKQSNFECVISCLRISLFSVHCFCFLGQSVLENSFYQFGITGADSEVHSLLLYKSAQILQGIISDKEHLRQFYPTQYLIRSLWTKEILMEYFNFLSWLLPRRWKLQNGEKFLYFIFCFYVFRVLAFFHYFNENYGFLSQKRKKKLQRNFQLPCLLETYFM